MYITTEEQGIINPDNYPRIDVYPDADIYVLCAFTERSPNQNEPEHRITIATYNDRVDADYALIHLYRSLDMAKNTWNSKDVPLLSDIWNEVKQKLSNDKHVSDLIENASLNITLPDKLTITLPYPLADKYVDDKEIPDEETDFIMSEVNKITTELINLLTKENTENTVFPIKTFNCILSVKKLSEK